MKGWVPLCAIEASIYTIPSTSTSLLYISKVDTTGLQPSSTTHLSPTKTFVSSFLSYHLLYPPHSTTRLRIHVFARSQGQYLFPGSVDNSTKKVLDDKGLLRWWKSTLSLSTTQITLPQKEKERLKSFYLIPGLTYPESLPYVPDPSPSSWVYNHPYSTLPSPLHLSPSPSPNSYDLTDHIPSFPDDPKSRFLHSLTSSSLSPSGSEGDYDDLHHSMTELKFVSGGNWTVGQRLQEVEKERDRERRRLVEGVKGGVGEWWERMGYRQECCSGVLVGFFVVGLEPAQVLKEEKEEKGKRLATEEELRDFKIKWNDKMELIRGELEKMVARTKEIEAVGTGHEEELKSMLERLTEGETHMKAAIACLNPPPAPSATLPPSQPPASPSKPTSHSHHSPPSPYPSSLPHSTFTKLWTQFHNQDYSLPSLSTLIPNLKKWESDVLSLVASEGEIGGEEEGEVRLLVEVRNEGMVVSGFKREVQVEKKVNTLAPRKKKKVV